MKLGCRNLVYSMALAGIMLLFLVGYFMYMLPSLYVDYCMEQNLKSIREQHNTYVEQGTYEGIQVKNAAACYSFKLPNAGDSFFITGKGFSAEVEVKDERLKQIMKRCREKLQSSYEEIDEEGKNAGQVDLEEEIKELTETIKEIAEQELSLPVEVHLLYAQDRKEEYTNETVKHHLYSDTMLIIEAGIENGGSKYTNYIAVEQTKDSIVISILPVITPEMGEIRPIVLQSLPMLCAVILLAVLLFSQAYSKGIVTPIVELVGHAGQMKQDKTFSVRPLSEKWEKREDEVRELADTLDEFYLQIKTSYRKLEEKNRELEEENKRQEIFLRASSHQLKTPIAAALLLVEGMLNEVGKYKETKTYLPRVKEQLLSMRKMVEDILYLNHCAENIRLQKTEVGKILQERLYLYQVAVAEKRLKVELLQEGRAEAETDEALLTQILDNLLSNAVKYTPEGECIRITVNAAAQIRIENFGVTIPDDLLPHIFEPFVNGSYVRNTTGLGSHGLGLYIASYYAKKLGACVTVKNGENSVIALLSFG